jgi:UV excision repair protein RAD23
LTAPSLKLIHTGKVLKDDDTLDSCGVKEGDFIVVMVAKPKKAAAAVAPVAVPKEEKPAASSTSSSTANATAAAESTAATTTTSTTTAATDATPTPAADTTATPVAPDAPEGRNLFPEEAITNLTSMGFPEAEVRHCLRVAHGNPDIAVEFLTNGIPDNVAAAADLVRASNAASPAASAAGTAGSAAATTARARNASSSAAAGPLQSLRNHPQFNALRRLVQTNPGALQQVLTQIGQQQPDLLAEINANQSLFLEMMNEPITEQDATAATASDADSAFNMPPGGMPDPMQMAQMIASLPDEQLQQMAAVMGMNPDQLRQMAASTAAGGMGGGNVIRLTAEEMAAVDRLTAMGFDRTEAAQAFLACDKNETLAANFLMDSMANGGGVFGGGDDDDDDGGNHGGSADDDDDDNMYD